MYIYLQKQAIVIMHISLGTQHIIIYVHAEVTSFCEFKYIVGSADKSLCRFSCSFKFAKVSSHQGFVLYSNYVLSHMQADIL